MLCRYDGCGKPLFNKLNQVCHAHYASLKRSGSVEFISRSYNPVVTFWECANKSGGKPWLDDPLSKLSISAEECWRWDRPLLGGYGIINNGSGKQIKAHRFAYELLREKIPDSLVIDHLCRNRGCVNPSHMQVVRDGTNTLRGNGPPAQNARKTHCKNGHELSGENLHISAPYGRQRRNCVICMKRRARDAYLRKTGRL